MTIDMDVIMRVAIIRDQNTAIIIAGEFNLAWVNLVNICIDSLSVVLDHSLCGRDCSSSDLRMHIWAGLNVATDFVEDDAVGASRLRSFRSLDMDIIVGITVIRDQGTTLHIAGKFNFIRIDLVHRGVDSLTIVLDDSHIAGDGGLGKLRVYVWAYLNVAADSVELDSMRAERLSIRGNIRGSLDMDVVVGVAIVRDEGTAFHVAGKLDLIRVDLVHGSIDCPAVVLDDSHIARDSGLCKLWMHIRAHLNITTDLVEDDAV